MMLLEEEMHFSDMAVEEINSREFEKANIRVDVLRLDKIHPVVSGNKWFKLKYYLKQAIEGKYGSVATFGGAYSNHILATAYACNKQEIKSIGIIRGEEPKHYSQTLLDAQALGMQFQFVSREKYQNKQEIRPVDPQLYFIPEGGYGITGVKGTKEIVQFVPDFSSYNYIVCAVGSGTMLSGIIASASAKQECLGISVMKNNFDLKNEIISLITDNSPGWFSLSHDYHFGGYAKYTSELIGFMNNIWVQQRLALDFVYTAKALFAVFDLMKKEYFMSHSKVLFIHSGGLQGNRSLKKGMLLYE
jgi:1-aminocyclopropane-1-carboxylate deaminase/D-cysteine desulfhydrase-like pyridoxal-dependent ACC family enzyme